MKYKGIIAGEASGSYAGLTFSHNRGGQYIRARAVPSNPNTIYQQAVRGYMSALAGRWNEVLTAPQRAAWAAYADAVKLPDALGEPRALTAMAMYCRCNVSRMQAGLDPVDDGPTELYLPTFTPPTVSFVVATQKLSVAFEDTDDWAGEVGGAMLVFGSRPVTLATNYFKGPYRFAGLVAGAAAPPSSPELLDTPFPFVADAKLFWYVRATRADGRLSATFRGSGIAA